MGNSVRTWALVEAGWVRAPACCTARRMFVCLWCRREVRWSEGADDDMPEVCDDCWCLAHAGEAHDGR